MNQRIRSCMLLVATMLAGPFVPVNAQMEFPGTPMGPSDELKAAEVMYVLPPVDQMEVQARMESNRTSPFKTFEYAMVRSVDISPDGDYILAVTQDSGSPLNTQAAQSRTGCPAFRRSHFAFHSASALPIFSTQR